MKSKTVLVSGSAGFIGFHLAKRLLEEGYTVIGLDDLNDYYDVSLKTDRLKELADFSQFKNYTINLVDSAELSKVFLENSIDYVINLAAQAGVRFSIEFPHRYIQSNIVGFHNILEEAKNHQVRHFIFASSSSVYGACRIIPFSVKSDNTNHPVSLYAATKKSNELIAHSYSSLFNIPVTGLRFFTVYGPYGRPDMAMFLFTRAILSGEPLKLFNGGNMLRDFTYVDDVVESVFRLVEKVAVADPEWDAFHPDSSKSFSPFRIFNVGNGDPVNVRDMIAVLEKLLGKKANIEMYPMQPGDVETTYADSGELHKYIGFKPNTSIEEGISKFLEWYLRYYRIERDHSA